MLYRKLPSLQHGVRASFVVFHSLCKVYECVDRLCCKFINDLHLGELWGFCCEELAICHNRVIMILSTSFYGCWYPLTQGARASANIVCILTTCSVLTEYFGLSTRKLTQFRAGSCQFDSFRCRQWRHFRFNYVFLQCVRNMPVWRVTYTSYDYDKVRQFSSVVPFYTEMHQWASCQIPKIAGAHAPGMPGTFSPPPEASDPDMHYGTWCMPESLTSGFLWSRRRGKTFPAFPVHAQPAMLRIW